MSNGKIYYGWLVAAAGFAVSATLGEALFSFGVFFKPLQEEFGWSRTLVSLGSTTFIIGYSVSAIITGKLADKYNTRTILLVSAFLAGSGLSLCSVMGSLDQFLAFLFISGLGSGATFSVPAATVQRWFRGRRNAATALAIAISGIGVGQLVFPPLLNSLILSRGWRDTYLIAGVLFFVIIFAASLVMKRAPDFTPAPVGEKTAPPAEVSWNARRTVASRAYAGIIYLACSGTVAWQIVIIHLVPHATDIGMSSEAAAAALGLLGGLTVPGRLSSGFIYNKIGWQRALVISLFGMTLTVLLLLFLSASWMLYAFVILLGFFWGIRGVAQWGILSEFFGLGSVGEILGITTGISMLVSAAAPYIAGFIFDSTGSYFAAFSITASALLTAGLVAVFLRKPRPAEGALAR